MDFSIEMVFMVSSYDCSGVGLFCLNGIFVDLKMLKVVMMKLGL